MLRSAGQSHALDNREAMKIDKLLKRYRIESGKHFRLKDYDPADTHGLNQN